MVLSAVLAALGGCGKTGPYSCIKVSGKVTYEDGSPIPADEIEITFISQTPPIDLKTPPKPGHATADGKTGKFEYATTFFTKDGIIVGEHKVIFRCLKGKRLLPLLPSEYSKADTTPVKVQSSGSPFEFKLPKPGRSGRTANH